MSIRAEDLVAVAVEDVPNGSAAKWAEGAVFRLPRHLLDGSLRHGASTRLEYRHAVSLFGAQHSERIRSFRAYTEQRPASARLPVSYQRIPAWMRSMVASAIGRLKRGAADRWAAFPRWPLDLSADFAADLAGQASPFAGGPTPVVLTHDLDSPEGLENLVRRFLDIEESCGARSASFVVPHAWPIDYSLLDEVRRRGNEIGIHGYDHSNSTPYLGAEARAKRLQAGRQLADRYGARGYRAPSLLRTRELLRDVSKHYAYDSSIPTSGGLFPVPNNGCASARPFRIEGVVEIPVTLPRDGSLLFLGHSAHEILDVWKQCSERIAASGGVVVLLAHCEERFSGSVPMLRAYRELLEYYGASGQYGWSSPAQIVERFHASAQTVAAPV